MSWKSPGLRPRWGGQGERRGQVESSQASSNGFGRAGVRVTLAKGCQAPDLGDPHEPGGVQTWSKDLSDSLECSDPRWGGRIGGSIEVYKNVMLSCWSGVCLLIKGPPWIKWAEIRFTGLFSRKDNTIEVGAHLYNPSKLG